MYRCFAGMFLGGESSRRILHDIVAPNSDDFYYDYNLRSGVPFVFVGAGKERLIQLLDYSSAAP